MKDSVSALKKAVAATVRTGFRFETELRYWLLGRRQAVRHRILDPAFGGSNPPAPANAFPLRITVYGPMWSDSGPVYRRSLSVSSPKARKGHVESRRGSPGRPAKAGLPAGEQERVIAFGFEDTRQTDTSGHFLFPVAASADGDRRWMN